jgi:hypothetical protein
VVGQALPPAKYEIGGLVSLQRPAFALCALALLCGCIFGQTTTGTLLGIVADPGDASVPGVRVDLKNIATGAVTTTTTGVEGIFRFNSLVPATYNLTITAAAGFKTYTQSNIALVLVAALADRRSAADQRLSRPLHVGREPAADVDLRAIPILRSLHA